MTAVIPEVEPASDSRRPAGRWGYEGSGLVGVAPRDVAEHAAVLLAVAVLAAWVTPGQGGLDEGRLGWGLLSLVPALVLTKPWARVPARELVVSVLLAVSAMAVPFLTPTGWSGGKQVSTWVYGVATFLVARSFARTPARRTTAAGVVALLALDQFSRAWLPWWGGLDPGRPMVGTFYWHNQFAVYVLAGAVVGCAFVVLGTGRPRQLGWVVTPFCVAGVILSTSRTTMVELVIGFVAVLVLAVLSHGRRAVPRWTALVAVSAGLLVLMTSGLVFRDGGGSPIGGTSRRAAGERFVSNGAYRLDFWQAGVDVWSDRPVTGSGFESFGAASARHMVPGAVRSPATHNGIVQGFADGGIVHGLPLLVAFIAAGWALARALLRTRHRGASAAGLGCALAGAALLSHGVVDFDWFFPSELAILAWCLAGSLAPRDGALVDAPADDRVTTSRVIVGRRIAGSLLAPIVAMAVIASDDVDTTAKGLRLAARESQNDRGAAAALIAGLRNPLRDPRPAAAFLDHTVSIGGSARLVVSDDEVQRAIDATAGLAEIDPAVAMQRELARYELGTDSLSALQQMARIVAAEIRVRPFLAIPLIRVLVARDQAGAAVEVAAEVVRTQLEIGPTPLGSQVWEVVAELDRLPETGEAYRCAYAGAQQAYGAPPRRLGVRPPGPPTEVSCDAVLRTAAGRTR